MSAMRVRDIIAFLFFAMLCTAQIPKQSRRPLSQTDSLIRRTNSLGRLLQHVVSKYFGGCVVIVIHDDTAFVQHEDLLRGLFQDSQAVSFIQKHINKTRKDPPLIMSDKCYHYLIILADIYNLGKIIPKDTANKVLIVSESTPWTVKEYLKSLASRSYTNLLIITHSISRRAIEGSYLLYTHKLYTDGSGSSLPQLLTSWMGDHTTQESIDLYPEKLNGGFKGHRLVIATAHLPPFAIRKDIISQRTIEWDGIDVRMIRLLGKTLNFTVDFRDPTTADSPIYAATTDVLTGKVSAAIGGIYRTNNITAKFDTSYSHMEDCAAFISLSSLALPKYRAVLGPFQPGVWILVCFVYLIAIIPLTMNTDYTLWSLIIHPSRLLEMFWFVFSTFTNSFVVKNPLLVTGHARNLTSLLIGFYWVFTIIITSCYTGSIMAFITVPVYPNAIDTVEQLLDDGFDVGTLDHDGWEKWFNWTKFDDPDAVKLLKTLEYVPTVKDGVKNATKAFFWSYAFLGSKILLEYVVQEKFAPDWSTMRSPMHISNECFVNFGVTFILPKNSIYTEPFNKVIMRARQSGLSQKIIRDVEWDVQRTAEGYLLPISEEYKKKKITIKDRKLELDDTQGMFLVLGAGVLIAILALSIECCVYYFKRRIMDIDTSASIVSVSSTTTSGNHLRVPVDWDYDDSRSMRAGRFSRSSI